MSVNIGGHPEPEAVVGELRRAHEALDAYEWLLGWCRLNAPAALEAMPTHLFEATQRYGVSEPL